MSLSDINKLLSTKPENFDEKKYIPLFKEKYIQEIKNKMMEKYKYNNVQMIPSLFNIVISSSISNLKHSVDNIYKIYNCLYLMTGIIPIYNRVKRSISQFKLQKNSITGCKVILCGNYMYEFLQRLVYVYLPNIKGFKGIKFESINNKSISIGISDSNVIKELGNYTKMFYFGFTITININSVLGDKEEIYDFLRHFSLPIRKNI